MKIRNFETSKLNIHIGASQKGKYMSEGSTDYSMNSNSMARGFKHFEAENNQYKLMMENFKKEATNGTKFSDSKNPHKANAENRPLANPASNKMNRDEKVIKPSDKTFEQILDEKVDNENSKPPKNNKNSNKATFLKRSEKSAIPKETKKYKYYANNFEQPPEEPIVVEKPKRVSSASQKPASRQQFKPIVKVTEPPKNFSQADEDYDSVEEFEQLEKD